METASATARSSLRNAAKGAVFSGFSVFYDHQAWIYILSNPAMPGMLRIAYSKDNPARLAEEVQGSIELPFPYVLEYSVCCYDTLYTTRLIHEELRDYKVQPDNGMNNWFRYSLPEAVTLLETYTGGQGRVHHPETVDAIRYYQADVAATEAKIRNSWIFLAGFLLPFFVAVLYVLYRAVR